MRPASCSAAQSTRWGRGNHMERAHYRGRSGRVLCARRTRGVMRGEDGMKSRRLWRVVASAPKNRRNNEFRKCARCHFALGIGIKISARLLGCSTKIPVMIRREGGATGIRLKSGKAGWRPISRGSQIRADHFQDGWMLLLDEERRACARHDALWSKSGGRGHSEFALWYGREQAKTQWAKNKHDPHYRLAKACRARIVEPIAGRVYL